MTVIKFPRRHRASSSGRIPNTAGSTDLLRFASADWTGKKYPGGIRPRMRHIETVLVPTPNERATDAAPPSASTTVSTDVSMDLALSRHVIMSSLHRLALEWRPVVRCNSDVDGSLKMLGKRLVLTREGLHLTQAELCRRIDCAQNRWSQYETGTRRITIDVANRLCDEFGLTLDWIYRGDPSGLPQRLNLRHTA